MFCLYFEFFRSVLRPDNDVLSKVDKIREHLLMRPRWPEMLTFEEMNQDVPSGANIARVIVSAVQATTRKRLLSVGFSKAERQLAKEAFTALAAAQSDLGREAQQGGRKRPTN